MIMTDWLHVPSCSSYVIPNENLSLVHHNFPDPELGSPIDQKV